MNYETKIMETQKVLLKAVVTCMEILRYSALESCGSGPGFEFVHMLIIGYLAIKLGGFKSTVIE